MTRWRWIAGWLILPVVSGCARLEVLRPPAEPVTIASFNIRLFSTASRTDAELAQIADLLQRYDLVALQELRDEGVLRRTVAILQQLGLAYAYEISPPVGRAVKEHYAFLYRQDRLQIRGAGRLYPDPEDRFIREPFYASFDAGDFDFTLVTIHVLFGSSESERRPEIEALAAVYQTIQDEDPTEQDVILLGDFNFPPTDKGFSRLKAFPGMVFLIQPPAKTTISDESLYDNVWFQEPYVREYAGESGIEKFDETMFGNDDRAAKLAISDHRPIWARFRTAGPDDD